MIILGIDLGKARTGVAICDKGELLASPLTVVQEHNRERLVERLAALARNMGRSSWRWACPGTWTAARGRAPKTPGKWACFWKRPPACLWSLWTSGAPPSRPTLSERHQHPGKRRKAVVDAVAATVILQNYLDARRLRRSQE